MDKPWERIEDNKQKSYSKSSTNQSIKSNESTAPPPTKPPSKQEELREEQTTWFELGYYLMPFDVYALATYNVSAGVEGRPTTDRL